MKLKLPTNKSIQLDQTLNSEERLQFINNLLLFEFDLDEKHFTLEQYFQETWNKDNTKVCMDIIGYYLSKGDIVKYQHDKEVMSKSKVSKMNNGDKNKINFSDLKLEDQFALGLVDYATKDERN
jgi:hypothetical protein